ncbi:phytoene desaturase family protein [Phaeocystidibacter marisrubri]|uniref:Phytoene desaturase n=1 Tax=Phaeocystidibacter marisrubri TaxID=1577780 RepID=A0A6L3ZID0_9FLAO|nr:phytoene desaturase family protein [Phaeocystidibacter marisrubri]KAB2817752.1 phytoene desaturase [Phaeocystidibacter marisrubri]GGH73746.1 phytoene dehydrogenase [Phaeocystidibacter marisrubri]
MSKPTAVVIGSGFAGMAAATSLAAKGYSVTVLEKNSTPGGRARKFSDSGFTFDMGPSWYWMPDVFEDYFNHFGKKVSDYYELVRLDPSYRVYFEKEAVDMPADTNALFKLFDKIEKGSGDKLKKFLKEAAFKYEVGIQELVYKPGRSLMEFADMRVVKGLVQMNLLSSMKSYIRRHFKDQRLIQLLEFPILFLGALPKNTPALYSLMNYADMQLGTWYPKGGMHKIVEAMVSLAEENGVQFKCNEEVLSFHYEGTRISEVITANANYRADVFVAAGDYHHIEQNVLRKESRQYDEKYWDSRKLAPSSIIYYVGLDTKVDELLHHNLFFDSPFDVHASAIYEKPEWPNHPLFYTCLASKTDETVAPSDGENLFILIPIAPGMKETSDIMEVYFEEVMNRIETRTGQDLRPHIVFKRDYAHSDFVKDYHAFKGNAYGLANTLDQTAILKPKMKSPVVPNLYYTGQLTTPGPGVPPSLISGRVVAGEIVKDQLKVTA